MMPTVTKNLIIINVLVFFGTFVAQRYGIDLTNYLGLHFFLASDFNPAQLITYMFMHGGFSHIFFNMFAVFMFGSILEQTWGPKRFSVLLYPLRHRCRAYSGRSAVYPVCDGTEPLRTSKHRYGNHPHGRISEYDDYRRCFRSGLRHFAGIRYVVSRQPPVRLPATLPYQSEILCYRICRNRIMGGTSR